MDDLGLQDEIVPVSSSHVASKNRYLYVNKKLHKMPSGIRLAGQAAGFCGEDQAVIESVATSAGTAAFS